MAWKELGIIIGVLVVWFSLMRFVLPAMGVPTCMSGACGVGPVGSCPHTDGSSASGELRQEPTPAPADETDRPPSEKNKGEK